MSVSWTLSALKDMVRQMKNSDAPHLGPEFLIKHNQTLKIVISLTWTLSFIKDMVRQMKYTDFPHLLSQFITRHG
jgi:hypothetical protein